MGGASIAAWNHVHLRGAMYRVLNGTATEADLLLVQRAIGANNNSLAQLDQMANGFRNIPEVRGRYHRVLSTGSLQTSTPQQSQSMSALPLQNEEQRTDALPPRTYTASSIGLVGPGPIQAAADRALLRDLNQTEEGTEDDYQIGSGIDQSTHGSENATLVIQHHQPSRCTSSLQQAQSRESSSTQAPPQARPNQSSSTQALRQAVPGLSPTSRALQNMEAGQPSANQGQQSRAQQAANRVASGARIAVQTATTGAGAVANGVQTAAQRACTIS